MTPRMLHTMHCLIKIRIFYINIYMNNANIYVCNDDNEVCPCVCTEYISCRYFKIRKGVASIFSIKCTSLSMLLQPCALACHCYIFHLFTRQQEADATLPRAPMCNVKVLFCDVHNCTIYAFMHHCTQLLGN